MAEAVGPGYPVEFKRTACGCAECVQCCRDQPGPLAPGDLQRIARSLGKTVADALGLFVALPGAVVKDTRTGRVWQIGTIAPLSDRSGRCVFLGADDRCKVHAVAPFGCAYADPHMPEEVWAPRAKWLYLTVQADAAYQSLRRTLQAARSWNPRTGRAT